MGPADPGAQPLTEGNRLPWRPVCSAHGTSRRAPTPGAPYDLLVGVDDGRELDGGSGLVEQPVPERREFARRRAPRLKAARPPGIFDGTLTELCADAMIPAVGMQMSGFIEVRPWGDVMDEIDWPVAWRGVVDLDVLGGESDGYGCLFGTHDLTGLTPLAPRRGLPPDVSREVLRDIEDFERNYPLEGGSDYHSWLSWAELEALDWDAREEVDKRLHHFRRDATGEWVLFTKGVWTSDFERISGLTQPAQDAPEEERCPSRPEGSVWEDGDLRIVAVRMSWRDVLESFDWAPTMEIMRALATLHGSANVRITVWFHN